MHRSNVGPMILLFSMLSAAGGAVLAQQSDESADGVVRESGEDSVFRGALHRIWARLRGLSPRPEADRAGRGRVVVTAGIRGAESTDSTLKPYWKNDRSRDQAFLQQVESLNAAQTLVDEGRLTEAVDALETFVERYPDSDLLPNAMFSRGLTQSISGDPDRGIRTLEQFVEAYPDHPLAGDAELAIAQVQRDQAE